MNKTKLAITAFWVVFVLPSLMYLLVNFYWWLFDGNKLNLNKIIAALGVLFIMLPIGMMISSEMWGD